MTFERYVAMGDSSTEGLDDPDGLGGYRGWANRLAEHIARTQDGLLYANLGVRGKKTASILEEQLEVALAMEPDLVTLFCGTNDVISRTFELTEFVEAVDTMQTRLVRSGARVMSFTLPDLVPVMPLAFLVRDRVEAMNEALRRLAAQNGVLMVDFASFPGASDSRLWSGDRLHANHLGHERIAAALAEALHVPGFDDSWKQPLTERPRRSTAARLVRAASRECVWFASYFVPWVWRHSRGRSSGDDRQAKRPVLERVTLPLL